MADRILKLIPRNPHFQAAEERVQAALVLLENQVPADSVRAQVHDTPGFVDCGSNLMGIRCPKCGAELSFGWWGEAMNDACDSVFTDLSVKLPCCGETSSLNDLDYQAPCGFACLEIQLLNPINTPEEAVISQVEALLGTEIRMIEAHL